MLAWQQRQQQSWGMEGTYFTQGGFFTPLLVDGKGVSHNTTKRVLEREGFSSRHARYTLRVLQSHDGAGGGREGVEVTGVLRIVAAAVSTVHTPSI